MQKDLAEVIVLAAVTGRLITNDPQLLKAARRLTEDIAQTPDQTPLVIIGQGEYAKKTYPEDIK